jgi:hypothetical protein
MKCNRISTQQVEAVQLISQRIEGDKVITKWSSCPYWLIEKIKRDGIFYDKSQGIFKVENIFSKYGLFEGAWVLNEDVKNNDIDLFVEENANMLLCYVPVKNELNVEEYLYTHEFDIK